MDRKSKWVLGVLCLLIVVAGASSIIAPNDVWLFTVGSKEDPWRAIRAQSYITDQVVFDTPSVTVDLKELDALKGMEIYKDEWLNITLDLAKLENELYYLFFNFDNKSDQGFSYTSPYQYYYTPKGQLDSEKIGTLSVLIDGQAYPCKWASEEMNTATSQFGYVLDSKSMVDHYLSVVQKQAQSGQVTLYFQNLVRTQWQ